MILLCTRCLDGVVILQAILQTSGKEDTAREYGSLEETELEEEASIHQLLDQQGACKLGKAPRGCSYAPLAKAYPIPVTKLSPCYWLQQDTNIVISKVAEQ